MTDMPTFRGTAATVSSSAMSYADTALVILIVTNHTEKSKEKNDI